LNANVVIEIDDFSFLVARRYRNMSVASWYYANMIIKKTNIYIIKKMNGE